MYLFLYIANPSHLISSIYVESNAVINIENSLISLLSLANKYVFAKALTLVCNEKNKSRKRLRKGNNILLQFITKDIIYFDYITNCNGTQWMFMQCTYRHLWRPKSFVTKSYISWNTGECKQSSGHQRCPNLSSFSLQISIIQGRRDFANVRKRTEMGWLPWIIWVGPA